MSKDVDKTTIASLRRDVVAATCMLAGHCNRNDGAVMMGRRTTDTPTPTLTSAQFAQLKDIAASLGDAEAYFVSDVFQGLRKRQSFSDAISNALSARSMHVSLCDSIDGRRTTMTNNTNRQYKRLAWTDPSAWDERGILRDGVTVNVPTYLIDAGAKMSEVYYAARATRSGAYNRPGFRRPLHQDAAALDERQQAHDAYLDYVENAWRDGPHSDHDRGIHGAGERGQGGPVEGMSCTVKGNPGGDHRFGEEGDAGTFRNVPGYGLICVSNQVKADAAISKDEAYRIYDAELREKWRHS